VISYPASLKAIGGARTGIAPANLLDVLDVNGNLHYWSDRVIVAPNVITGVPTDTNVEASGPGAILIVPDGPAACTINWSDWTEGTGFPNGTTEIVFDGNGGATIQLTYSPSTNNSHNDYGVGGVHLVGAALGVTGPVAIPNLPDAGSVLTVQIFTTAWSYFGGSFPAAIYVIGPASANPDDTVHASVTWLYNTYAGAPEWEQPASSPTTYTPWLLSVSQFSFHRSLQTDIGSFVVQNLSGDTLSRDVEKIIRASALEGAFFVYRLWQPDAQASWLEVHGTLTVDEIGVDTVQLKGSQLLNPSQDDTPLEIYCETCQLQWGGRRCGSTQATECSYSFQTCQVLERIMVTMNDYEKNYGEATANTASNVINRRRKI
jgi:hypothetical protein